MDRRKFLALLGTPVLSELVRRTGLQTALDIPKADITLHISPVEIEVAPRKIIKTTGYNGSAPGPVLRLREGQPVTVDVFNETKTPELVHWHGLFIPSEVDGSEEEGTPMVPAGGVRRYSFVPRPSGTRWYHSHVHAGRDLKRATYTGQFGFLYVEPKEEPGQYDAEVFLALHGWDPYLSSQGDDGSLEVTYPVYSINSHALGSGDPIRVKEGQKVLFRILNANATEQHRIALPGHKFKVVSLDGNAVPVPREVDTIEMGPAERVDADRHDEPARRLDSRRERMIKCAMPAWASWWNMPTATARRNGPRRRILPGTTRFLGAKRRLPNRQVGSCHSSSARNSPAIAGWITGPLTVNPSRRPIPSEFAPIPATAFASITKVTKRTPFTCTGTASN